MKLLSYWPLGFLVLLPLIILLYILKQKAQDYHVSSTFLWKETYKNTEATKPWEKLRNNLLMYLQLLLMFLIIFALASPYLTKGGNDYKNIVLVIDNSGSMNARYDGKNTGLSIAKKKAKEYIEHVKSGVNVTLVTSNTEAQIVLSGAEDKSAVKNAIDSIQITEVQGNLEPSLALVKSLGEQWDSYETVLFGDQVAACDQINGTIVDVSRPIGNTTVDYVSHSMQEDGTVTILAKVSNYSTEDVTTDVNLYLNDNMTDIKNVTIPAGQSSDVYFEKEKLPENLSEKEIDRGIAIKAEINEKDLLQEDNVSYDVIKENQEQKVMLVTEQNVFLEKAVLASGQVEVYKTNSVSHLEENDDYDLYIFDGTMPKTLPKKGNILFVNPQKNPPNNLFELGKEQSGCYVKTINNTVTQYIGDYSFGVSAYTQIKKPAWAETFLKADKSSVGFIGNTGGRVVAVLAFDIHKSDLALQAEFPMLMAGILGESLESTLLENNVITAGTYYTLNGVSEQKMVSGMYEVSGERNEETVNEYLAVNFAVSESNLLEKGSKNHEDTENVVAATEVNTGRDLKNIVLGLILIGLLAEWIVYLRRL